MKPLLAILVLLIGSQPALAWGDKGHAVIAHIAWHYLSPATRAQIDALLQLDSSELADADFASQSTWADAWRDSDRNHRKLRYEQTRRWHYINLALDRPDVARACYGSKPLKAQQRAADGPAKACIVDKIEQFARDLQNPRLAPAEHLRALQFLIHFVGDLHQPLHASDRDDNGGNEVRVTARGFKRGSLHGYWDSAVIYRLGRKPEAIARKLIVQTERREQERWRSGTVREWALESLDVARTAVYAPLPAADVAGIHALDDDYTGTAKIITAQQLMKAGVRLAHVLERSLATH